MDDLIWNSGYRVAELIRARTISPTEAVDAALKRLEAVEPQLNALVTVTAESARQQAAMAENTLMSRDPATLPPLFGVPITVKDLTDTAGVRTTYGSCAFAEHVPERDGINWARLRAAGAILIGKTTTPEFGSLGVTESLLTGVTANPWNLGRTAGGSSGGAGAATAAGIAPFGWGSDGGGSIRIPAACCGAVGFKPSRGRIPVDEAWETVGTEGPLARFVVDCALLLAATAGHDPRDPMSIPDTGEDFVAAVLGVPSLRDMRIAFVPSPNGARVSREVAGIVAQAVLRMEQDGRARVDEWALDLPDPISYFLDFWSPWFAHVAEAKAGDGGAIGPVAKAMAARGASMTAARYYHVTTAVRGAISAEFNRLFAECDLIVTPTMPTAAFPHPGMEIGGYREIDGYPIDHPALDFHRFTEPPSHAGLPAITVPCGFTSDGLPVGLQIIGPLYQDRAVLAAAAAFEMIQPWQGARPTFART